MSKHFGRVLAALRQEQRDENWRPWTQKHLGTLTGLGEDIIAKLEQGRRTPDAGTLALLVGALQLTAWESREFFLLAAGWPPPASAANAATVQTARARIENLLARLMLPAFVYDDYGDLIAANTMALSLVGFSTSDLSADPAWTCARFHVLRLICDPQLGYAELLGATWPDIALRQMHLFRRVSLKRRGTRLLSCRLAELERLSPFRTLWEQAAHNTAMTYGEFIIYQHPHPRSGQRMRYTGAPLVVATPFGDVTLGMFTALDADTAAFFMVEAATQRVDWLADWPKPEDEFDEEEEEA